MGTYDQLLKPKTPPSPIESVPPSQAQSDNKTVGERPKTEKAQPKPETVSQHILTSAIMPDVMNDVLTSSLQGVNLKEWQEIIENTETHNSSLRITEKEKQAVEDLITELARKYKIKTSMNEVARLGLLYLIQDFKKNKSKSIISQVKKA